MPTKFDVPITATDKTAAGVRSAYKNFETLTKPVDRLYKATSKFSKGSGLGDLLGKFGQFKAFAGDATKGIAEAAEGVGILGGVAGASAAGVGILAVALGTAADKAIRFAAPIAAAGFEIGRTSKLLNVGARDLQVWRGAAALNGVSSEAMTESLGNLGNTLNDARWGRNNQALALLNRLGIAIPKTADGAVDTSKAMVLLADAIKRNDPQTRQMIAGVFGVTGALALLSKGSKGVQADMDAYAKSGALMTDKQIKASEAYSRQLTILSGKWQHLKNDFAEDWLIPGTGGLLDFLSRAVGWIDRLVAGKNALTGNRTQAPDPWISGGGAGAVDTHAWTGPRTNNPGNLRNPSGVGFQSFATPDQGLAAMGRQLRRYQDKYGLNTVGGIVSRYAPPSENNTAAYIADVAAQTGFAPGQAIDLHDPKTLAALEAAMIKHEQGRNPFSQNQILADNGAGGTVATAAPDPFLTAQAAPAGGSVKVDINLRGAPAGTVARTSASGDVEARTGIEHSMMGQV